MKQYKYFIQLLVLFAFLLIAGCRSTPPPAQTEKATEITSEETQQKTATVETEATKPEEKQAEKEPSRGIAPFDSLGAKPGT